MSSCALLNLQLYGMKNLNTDDLTIERIHMQLVRFARLILLLRAANLDYSSAGAMVARQTSNLEAVGSSPTRNVKLFFLQNQIQNCPSTIITCFLFVPDLIILYFPRLTFFYQ